MTVRLPATDVPGRRWALAVAVLGVLGLAFAVPAAAQEDDQPQVRIQLSEFSGVLGPGTLPPPEDDTLDPDDAPDPPTTLELRALVENRGEVDLASVRLLVEVYPAVESRSELRDALEGDLATSPLLIDDPALRDGTLAPGEFAGVSREYDEELIPWSDDGGVYPVRIAATRGTTVLDEVVTAVVWLPDQSFEPINTVLVWPLDDQPWRTSEGAYPSGIDRPIQPGERLDSLVRVLEQRPSAPVVLAPAPHLLEDLRDRADGFTALERTDQQVQDRRQVVPESSEARRSNDLLRRLRELSEELPYTPVVGAYAGADLSALHATGDPRARDLASDAAAIGRLRLQLELARAPDGAAHLLDGGVSAPVLDLLPGDQLLVPADAVTGPTVQAAEPIRALRSPAGRSLSAFVADEHLSELTTDPRHPAGPIAGVQRLIAESALLHLERPETAGRSLLLLPDPSWDPGIEAGGRLIDQLDRAPWLELNDLSSTFAAGRRASAPVELAEPTSGDFPATFEVELEDALSELAAARAMLPPEASTIGDRTPSELEDALIRSTSTWLRTDTQRVAQQLVGDVRDEVDDFIGGLTVSESSVTLTSDTGQIPVTLQRTSGDPVVVQVEVASGGQLLWPEGRTSEPLLLEEDASVTVSFPTEALSSGTHPVRVVVSDPTGERELYEALVSVQSHAISGPALAGISAVVVVLLLIGALRRRRPEPTLHVVDDDADDDGRLHPSDQRY